MSETGTDNFVQGERSDNFAKGISNFNIIHVNTEHITEEHNMEPSGIYHLNWQHTKPNRNQG